MFIVLEIQGQENTASVLHNVYADQATAENKYHTILAAAATSALPVHSAVLFDERGIVLKTEYYEHKEVQE